MDFRDILRIGRTQTASASIILLATAWMLGGGSIFSLGGLAIIAFAWLSHVASFGSNSILDSAMKPSLDSAETVDEADSSKARHPIIQGRVSLGEAATTFFSILAALFVVGAILPFLFPGNTSMALLFFVFWLGFGLLYNAGMSIYSIWKFFFISTCFTGMFLYGYFLNAGSLSTLIVLCAGYIYLREWGQNGIEGECKDISAPEENMLRKLGAELKSGRFEPGYAYHYGITLTALEIGIGAAVWWLYAPNIVTGIIAGVLMGIGIYLMHELLKAQEWNRSEALKTMSAIEILFIYSIVLILLPILPFWQVVAVLVLGIVHFPLINLINWGTIYPDV